MKSKVFVFACVVAVALGFSTVASAANSIAVTGAAALNGTSYGLAVTVDGGAGEAVVISQHPVNEQSFTVSFYINPNSLTMCAGLECRLWISRAFGNRDGLYYDAYRVGLKKTATGFYRIFVWYKDLNSANPGKWEQVGEFFAGSPTSEHKITVEWVAASGTGTDDGTISVYKDDVLTESHTGVDSPFEIDNSRIGHVNGAVKAGAIGTFYLDEYVSTK